MKRSIGTWLLLAAAVPACGAEIDVGGPRENPGPDASGGAVSEADQSTAGEPATPVVHENPSQGNTGGASQEVESNEAGAGPIKGAAGSEPGPPAVGGTGNTLPGGPGAGSFKVLVLSTALEFMHGSIDSCQRLLTELGQTPDEAMPEGTAPSSQFTIDIAKDDLSDFTDAKLKDYGMLFWCNPSGPVFSNAGVNGKIGKAAMQQFVEGGGAWGGVHSASDFERNDSFPWFTDVLLGGNLSNHDSDGTPGTVVVEADYANHPVMRGIPASWSTQDEWYYMTRDIRALPGFQILASLASDHRPVVWTKELGPEGKGRMFYTIRGHNETVYAEPSFKRLVLNGILWATHRL